VMSTLLDSPIVVWILLAGIGGVLTWGANHLKEGKLRDAFKMAAGTAAGLAYAYQANQAAQGLPIPSQQAAVNVGVAYLAKSVPGIVAHFGKSGDDLADTVTGELGKLLAVDPNVTVVPKFPTSADAQSAAAVRAIRTTS
jgi:hypothetical protein